MRIASAAARRSWAPALILALLVAAGGGAGAREAASASGTTTDNPERGEPAMPLRVRERLWESPGPEQSGPGAPRLLIVSPSARQNPISERVFRYAGRVEPEDARVSFNGRPIRVWPGGTFTGIESITDPEYETWTFTAEAGGQTTTVERFVERLQPLPTPPRWPLAFYGKPVRPTGDYYLPPGQTLTVRLYASPGHRASVRIGENGPWQAMTYEGPDYDAGGVYKAVLAPPRQGIVPRAEPVYFRLDGRQGGNQASLTLADSGLRLAGLAKDRDYAAVVTGNLATFLKAPTGWERWGNWVRGTPFPVFEARGDRLRTGFYGAGEAGWIESQSAAVEWTNTSYRRVRLGPPKVRVAGSTLTLAWPSVRHPIAVVYYHEGSRLRISLPGGCHAEGTTPMVDKPVAGPFAAIAWEPGRTGDPKTAPSLTVELREPLWGYAMQADPANGLRLVVRVAPRLNTAGGDQPLQGLRVMIDAGHGGSDLGALGPSGLAEADLNLVQAALLERELAGQGAIVRQVRRADEYIDLDRRVDAALAWDPDLFISLHHNSVGTSEDPTVPRGTIVFYHYPHAQPLAGSIAAAMDSIIATDRTPPTRVNVFRVNRNLSLCPSVLIETGFLCQPEDEYLLRRTETLEASARAIAAGIRHALGVE